MRIGFLMLCHKLPQQAAVLAEKLLQIYDCHIFLHADRKSMGFWDFTFPAGVTVLPEEESVPVEWGTFSQCRASLALLRTAVASGEKFDRLWLISGQDLPIAGRKAAEARFAGAPAGAAFLEVLGPGHPLYPRMEMRNRVGYPPFLLKNTLPSRMLRRLWQLCSRGRERSFPVPLYYGSSWWCVPYGCAVEMLGLLDGWTGWEAFFSRSLCPDESFFQTLFMQTSFAGHQQPVLTYVDWTGCRRSPRTFTAEDLPRLREQGGKYLLARKFDLEREPELGKNLP